MSFSGTCPRGNDGICDVKNNCEFCDFDNGDCCLTVSDCSKCELDYCNCHETGESHCERYQGCVLLGLSYCMTIHATFVFLVFDCSVDRIGDNICDSENNVLLCNYDGGDCCPINGLVACRNCNGESCACQETGLTSCLSNLSKLTLFITQKLINR